MRRLKTFDLTLITIGSVIGSGIFRAPAVVAQRAHLPALILCCWVLGGVIGVTGAFIFAELAARRQPGGGVYGYLRDAYHPVVGFLFGWTLMLISGTGPTAAAAVLFASYLEPLTGLTFDTHVVAVITIAALAGINLLGVRQGGTWQNIIVFLKVGALATFIVFCLAAHPHAAAVYAAPLPFIGPATLLGAFGVAMLPVLFTYAGFQSPTFVTAETHEPARTISRGLIVGMGTVAAAYLLANISYLHVLGAAGLAATVAPAADAMRAVAGPAGSRFIALAIALSTLGYLSAVILTQPRVYYQMAADGTFFKALAWIAPKTNVPVPAILLQVTIASVIALSGTYEQIINWIVAPQWLFYALAAAALFVFRRRDAALPRPTTTVPGHPFTTIGFLAALLAIFVAEVATYPRDTLFGAGVLATGAIAYWLRRRSPNRAASRRA